ncbi:MULTISPECIES: UDP-2,3-diacylglucosamine diphosphatase [Thiorhodovibrio]|uniref:UDP-2,3-diacylglucosamine diphosphatase n=1 Tax=Thiorhodovibrio TaxID=61593 RepID=UPI00191339D0|nr:MULTISPECIES: UDP-2,3-diacylglucosamine diphosphatase [Thiorhodovibrio]MBK5970385.1 UDP-2,3-diacylglucosamine hydrolase [Thiorhodovibrio winogradskyi]WPL14312.1 UDP-2,3-diacylglucosamine hydrolase [Thiorhodovibrio litoralis]
MSQVEALRPLRYRTIWISDIHLGFHGCQADFLRDFLRATACRQLYLVGDIIDLWALRKGLYWPSAHQQVVQAVLEKARNGTQVTYVPGNHDELLRGHLGEDFAGVAIRDEVVHTTVDGRRLLVLHGDKFDHVVQKGPWLAHIGATLYDLILGISQPVNRIRRRLGLRYWSLAAFLKRRVKNAVNYIGNFEQIVATEARKHRVDGMVCGHIHHAEMREIDGVDYCNCGDWVESCTALVEHHDGRMELLRWTEIREVLGSDAAKAPEPLAEAA